MTIKSDDADKVGEGRRRPAAPRWQVHVEMQDNGGRDMLRFRAELDTRLLQQPAWRAMVITAEVGLIALTYSAFGDSYDAALSDANSVLVNFGVPGGSMRFEMISPDELAQRRASPLPLLLGVKEVAELLGYSRQRISQLAKESGTSFPQPVTRVEATPLWLGDEIHEWQEKHRDDVVERKKTRRFRQPA